MIFRKIAICLIAISALSSCKKVLENDPEFSLDGRDLTSLDDYEFVLTGTYRGFHANDYYGATAASSNAFAVLPDMLADNFDETGESLGNEEVFSNWTYSENEPQVENTWLAAYQIISRTNVIFRGIDAFASADPGRVNRIKAQAYAIRALAHFDLMRYFVDDYDRNSTSPGIPYITVYDYNVKPSRGTVKEDYDHVIEDLNTALSLMDNMDQDINGGGSRAYIDAEGVHAILARVYLYANEWQSAIDNATIAIDNRPLAPIEDFQNIWTDASNSEVLWANVFDAGQGTVGDNAYSPSVNRSEYEPNANLVSLYDDANDIRYFTYFGFIEDDNGDPRLVMTKYLAKASQLQRPDGIVNFKAFRTGEMYLIRAEAYARLGGANEVLGLDDLNTLRSARILNYVPVVLAGQALLDEIQVERRKELFAEGHRFFDLKRTTRLIERVGCSTFCTLEPSAREWTWPIPKPEIDANPNILPQNPGY